MEIKTLRTDVLIVGGGTSGIYSALTLGENTDIDVLIIEKGHIKRSGCLAAGVNALNAYIVKGKTPEDYVKYACNDVNDIARKDLLLSMSKGLNKVTKRLEKLGLVILKDENGEYVTRGDRNIKINGENIKPLLAESIKDKKNISVLNHVYGIDYIVDNNRIIGIFALSVDGKTLYSISAKAVICATGGAAGIYKPNNPGFSRHKLWYSPFNTGAGYAMGIRAGAEMTSFEMRFIALRCKDTIAPTGTLAQGVNAKQINSKGEDYGKKYGFKTYERVYGTVMENIKGNGPCYLETKGIDKKIEDDLIKAYFNMAPSQSLKWIESGNGPKDENVEIQGTEPYIVGGHTGSGYWVNDGRETTIEGLFAAGDVAGACPQKYVTGALVEGEIAAYSALKYIENKEQIPLHKKNTLLKSKEIKDKFSSNGKYLNLQDVEGKMQDLMDRLAGGISSNYGYTSKGLLEAQGEINKLEEALAKGSIKAQEELLEYFEIKDRLAVAKVLLKHLYGRKETRWNSFGEYLDYPRKSESFNKYVNSVTKNNKTEIIYRDLI